MKPTILSMHPLMFLIVLVIILALVFLYLVERFRANKYEQKYNKAVPAIIQLNKTVKFWLKNGELIRRAVWSCELKTENKNHLPTRTSRLWKQLEEDIDNYKNQIFSSSAYNPTKKS